MTIMAQDTAAPSASHGAVRRWISSVRMCRCMYVNSKADARHERTKKPPTTDKQQTHTHRTPRPWPPPRPPGRRPPTAPLPLACPPTARPARRSTPPSASGAMCMRRTRGSFRVGQWMDMDGQTCTYINTDHGRRIVVADHAKGGGAPVVLGRYGQSIISQRPKSARAPRTTNPQTQFPHANMCIRTYTTPMTRVRSRSWRRRISANALNIICGGIDT